MDYSGDPNVPGAPQYGQPGPAVVQPMQTGAPMQPAGFTMQPTAMNAQMNLGMQLNAGLQMAQQAAAPQIAWAPTATGIQALAGLDKVHVSQQLDMIQMMTHIDQPNKYQILTEDGLQLFMMEEENSFSALRHRAFDVKAKDMNGGVAFNITRPCKQCSYCFFCCACIDCCKSYADIFVAGRRVSKLIQNWSFSNADFTMYDDLDAALMGIKSNAECCTGRVDYNLSPVDGSGPGYIRRFTQGMGVGMNKYEIKFPEGATPESKAMCICINILMDYRFHYYVSPHARHGGGRRRRRGRRR